VTGGSSGSLVVPVSPLGTIGRVRQAIVLVVDDDPVILQLLKVNLELEGYRVVTAADGESALASARQQPPDAVVLDVMMPGLSGLDVAIRLREQADGDGPPVMLLSAKAQAADLDAGLAVAADYVTKPFDSLDFVERLAALIALSHSSRPQDA
jgi:DNA-binding response OmpR family regulator